MSLCVFFFFISAPEQIPPVKQILLKNFKIVFFLGVIQTIVSSLTLSRFLISILNPNEYKTLPALVAITLITTTAEMIIILVTQVKLTLLSTTVKFFVYLVSSWRERKKYNSLLMNGVLARKTI